MAEQEYFENKRDTDNESDSDTQSHTDSPALNNTPTSELASELDDLLDEIDTVLESNAEEFVKSYVQKGGQ
ncbi:MAG TPA: ubiquitin-like protein Pup [Acidimicrobiales bacterium]|jgi:ubiquitin-like protein Pup|nr:ubiquitin-like protein Pup [Acidimicrobiales bacterium]